MTAALNRRGKEGAAAGLVAGVLFAIAQVLLAAVAGRPPTFVFRLVASVLLGRAAFDTTTLSGAIVVGTVVHLALSAFYGFVYGSLTAGLSDATQISSSRQAALGLGFGALVWLLNLEGIARLAYPWFLGTPQLVELALHAAFFGLPLGLLYASAERRVPAALRT
ncbi:MAG: hypothetical protein JNL21_03570 [Myxococcales bacterium]|nr:hypothetical protein [Myxococcales bacterium]